jgi:uncharacterized protein (TIRG00374 family)
LDWRAVVVRKRRFTPKRTMLLILLVVAAVATAAALFAREDLYAMFQALGGANPLLVILAFGVYLLGAVFWAGRWNVTLSRVGHRVGLRNLYVVIFGGIFVNNVTPFTYSGGDPVARAYLLKKTQRVPYPSGFATIMSEFILDVPVFISFVMVGLLLSIQWTPPWLVLLLMAFWTAAVVGWSLPFLHIIRGKMAAARIGTLVARIVGLFRKRTNKAKITRGVKRFYAGAEGIINSRRVVLYVIAFSVILWMVGITRLFVIFQALGYSPPLAMLILATTIPWMAGLIPLLPGGLGTVDVTMTSVFLLFGMPVEIAVSAVLIERAITLVFGTALGAVALSHLGIRVLSR